MLMEANVLDMTHHWDYFSSALQLPQDIFVQEIFEQFLQEQLEVVY